VLGRGMMGGAALMPLAPPFQSNWLWVHVGFAWLAFGAFTMASAVGVVYLLKDREGLNQRAKDFYEKFPPLEILNDLGLRLIAFGFVADTVMITTGAIWAGKLWGRYWSWDPVETWSLITWLIYGTNLHLRLTYGWKGRKAAWLAIISIAGVIILFFGLGFISKLHTRLL